MDTATIISNGVVAALTALAFPGTTVVARKRAVAADGDPVSLVLVSLLPERFEPATTDPDYAYDGYWPVLVTIAVKSPGKLADAATVRGMRQSIRRALMDFTLPGSGVVIDGQAGYEPHPPFDAAAAGVDVDWSPQLFVYRTQEARGAV